MKVAIVTGGTKGLGYGLSMAFAEAGFAIIAVYQRDDAQAKRFCDEVKRRGLEGRALRGDVADPDTGRALADAPEVAHATQLVLVNNAAASFEPRPFHLLGWGEFECSINTGLRGSVLCTKALLRSLVATKGWVIGILSAAITESPMPKGFAAYAAAKQAQLTLNRCLASEYGSQGLRVLSVSPGFMDTPMTAAWADRVRSAVKKGSDVESVAKAVVSFVLKGCDASGVEVGRGENHLL